MNAKVKNAVILTFVGLFFAACTTMTKYAPYGEWGPNVETLGRVDANSGHWPLSLHSPPPEYTYYSALRSVAHGKFGVPENEVVLGEVSVTFGSELDGTIRDWKASAIAGRDRHAKKLPPSAPTQE